MDPILTITRTHPDGTNSRHVLSAAGQLPGYLLTGTHEDSPATTEHIAADTPEEAVAAHPRLRTVDGRDVTEIVRNQPAEVDRDDLLDALRPTRNATDLQSEDQDEAFSALGWPLDEAAERWATWHRVTLDGWPLYGVRVNQRHVVLVHGEARRPHQEWRAILDFTWDSSDYSAVGMAGSGSQGLHLIRPGLVALVHATDEELEVKVMRVSRRTSMLTLVRRHLSSKIDGDPSYAQLALAAHGFSAEDVYPGDGLDTMLSLPELHRLLDSSLE